MLTGLYPIFDLSGQDCLVHLLQRPRVTTTAGRGLGHPALNVSTPPSLNALVNPPFRPAF